MKTNNKKFYELILTGVAISMMAVLTNQDRLTLIQAIDFESILLQSIK